jgi:superfamily II DNA or RNA helicase
VYFSKNYNRIKYPIDCEGKAGLRQAQLGAIHSIASHFTLHKDPVVVVMPTGSGKTAVLEMTAFVQRAQRVLIITPSMLVRNQIVEDIKSLKTLKAIHVLDTKCPEPKVKEVTAKIKAIHEWETLRIFDVVVGTPNSVSPGVRGVAVPPADLFDLVLVDEAHHSPARIWNELLKAFPTAKRVLFTATPFRRDKQGLEGRLLYVYPLSKAFEDGIFGKIEYRPVEANEERSDIAIAKAAEQVVREDQSQGLNHYLMVRTDSRKRANELKDIYNDHTNLNLKVIHSGISPKNIKISIAQLRGNELNGIICVDMFGEGFDLPNLKIAAIHSPHKSLEITLQFIGRFARTNANNIDVAKFLAVPSEIEVEGTKLFNEDATWQKIITNLSEVRINEEIEVGEAINTFRPIIETELDYTDISLYSLRPYFHAKIYKVDPNERININQPITLPNQFEIVRHEVSENLNTAAFLTREIQKQRWTHQKELARIEHDLFIIFYDKESNLLFINASRKSNSLYEYIACLFTNNKHSVLPQKDINSVLATLTEYNFFNIGMRRLNLSPHQETYRISAGPSTQNAVSPIDGRMYSRGHVQGTALDKNGKRVNIGYSSAAKVWSNASDRIPIFIEWAKVLADRIHNYKNFSTGSSLDLLSVGEEVESIPDGVISACWNLDVYTNSRELSGLKDSDPFGSLSDFDVNIDRVASDNGVVRISFSNKQNTFTVDYSLKNGYPEILGIESDLSTLHVTIGRGQLKFVDYLKDYPIQLFLKDFSILSGNQISKSPESQASFDKNQINEINWSELGVNIQREFTISNNPPVSNAFSIHDYLMQYLPTLENQVVFYDHGPGEMADFVAFNLIDSSLFIRFFHCKGANGRAPGSRIDDVYEVAGQVIKSLMWLKLSTLKDRIHKREKRGSLYLKGSKLELDGLVSKASNIIREFEMVLVQPGISKSGMKENVATVLSAADSFIIRNGCNPLCVWGSV